MIEKPKIECAGVLFEGHPEKNDHREDHQKRQMPLSLNRRRHVRLSRGLARECRRILSADSAAKQPKRHNGDQHSDAGGRERHKITIETVMPELAAEISGYQR